MKRNFYTNINKLSLVFAVALLSTLICSCGNLISSPKETNNSDVSNINFVLISGIGGGVSSARSAVPEFEWKDYNYDFNLISNYDSTKTDNEQTIVEAIAKTPFSYFENGTWALAKGITYKFFLTGYDKDENKVISGETVITLDKDNQAVPFKMYPVQSGTGTLYLNLLFPNDGVIQTVKGDVSETRGETPSTVIDVAIVDGKKSAQMVLENTIAAGKTQYANIFCYDVNGKLVFDYAESVYVIRDLTSVSTIEITELEYYSKLVMIDVYNSGAGLWKGAPSSLILISKTDSNKKYTLTGVEGEYSGYIPNENDEYEIYYSVNNRKIDSGVSINPEESDAVSLNVLTLTLPKEKGLVFEPSSVADSGIILTYDITIVENYVSKTTTHIVVPAEKDFKLDVSVAAGYKVPDPKQLTINGTDYALDANNKTTAVYNVSEAGQIASGVTGWVAEHIGYDLVYDVKFIPGSDSSEGTYTFETECTYYSDEVTTLVKDYSHIVHPENTSIVGWYIYSIAGVTESEPFTPITELPKGKTGKVVLKPYCTESAEITYHTVIMAENVGDDGYSIVWEFDEYGIDGTSVTSDVHDYPGYTVDRETKVIHPGTVLTTRYKRNVYTVNLNTNGGVWSDSTSENKVLSGKYEASIPGEIPVKQNAIFTGWKRASDGAIVASLPSTYGETDTERLSETYTAQYNSYIIKTRIENLEGGYDETIQVKPGTPGETVSVNASPITGFKDPVISSATVNTEGTAIVSVKYDRKDITLMYNLSSGGKWSNNSTANKTVMGKYGASVTVPETPTRENYSFAGWSPSVPSTFPATNTTYTATWIQTKANYKVEVYVENANGTYDYDAAKSRISTEVVTIGTTPSDAEITAGLTDINGYTMSVTKTAVTADGNAVQTVKYTRKIINYTFKLAGGTISGKTSDIVLSGKYGTAVTKPSNPVRNGFKFIKWDNYSPTDTIFGLTDKTFTAVWGTSVTGVGENPMVSDIELVVTGTTTITATVQVPYANGDWTINWIVNGVVRSEHGSSITIKNATAGYVYSIFVEVEDTSNANSLLFTKQIDYSFGNTN